MTLLLVVISAIYVCLLFIIGEIFQNIKVEVDFIETTEKIAFSIVVPFRNEDQNLPNLIESIGKLNYPINLYEIIFCNDHSTDNSQHTIEKACEKQKFNRQFIQNSADMEGKKAAITHGVNNSRFDFIVTTDADCRLPANWLNALNGEIEKQNVNMILGPVQYNFPSVPSILDTYQVIENTALIGITAVALRNGGGFMANGANLCFRKAVFFEVAGYSGNENIPSGDDEFLLHKFNMHSPGKTKFLKSTDAMVQTETQHGLFALLNQRIRWASKGRHHRNPSVLFVQFAIAFFYIALLFNLFYSGIFLGSIPLLLKVMGDMFFFTRIRSFFSLNIDLTDQLMVSLLQLFITPVSGMLGLFGKYTWKNRVYKT